MKQLFHIHNSIDEPEDVLLLRIGEKHACFVTTGKSGTAPAKLVYCKAEEWHEKELNQFFQDYPSLGKYYQKTFIAFDHPVSSLIMVGKGCYDKEFIPPHLLEWVNRHFTRANLYNQFAVLPLKILPVEERGVLCVDIREQDFSLMVFRGDKVLMGQNFAYTIPADILYYLLKAFRQFGLLQDEAELQLSGLVDQESALYRELHQYFNRLSFRTGNWNLKDYEYPPHYFTALNDLAACVS